VYSITYTIIPHSQVREYQSTAFLSISPILTHSLSLFVSNVNPLSSLGAPLSLARPVCCALARPSHPIPSHPTPSRGMHRRTSPDRREWLFASAQKSIFSFLSLGPPHFNITITTLPGPRAGKPWYERDIQSGIGIWKPANQGMGRPAEEAEAGAPIIAIATFRE
jgi:hypothetical protein